MTTLMPNPNYDYAGAGAESESVLRVLRVLLVPNPNPSCVSCVSCWCRIRVLLACRSMRMPAPPKTESQMKQKSAGPAKPQWITSRTDRPCPTRPATYAQDRARICRWASALGMRECQCRQACEGMPVGIVRGWRMIGWGVIGWPNHSCGMRMHAAMSGCTWTQRWGHRVFCHRDGRRTVWTGFTAPGY